MKRHSTHPYLPLNQRHKKIEKYDNHGLLYWLLLLATIAIIASCQKRIEPNCGHVYQLMKVYNNTTDWRYLRTDTVMKFGLLCGDEYDRFVTGVEEQLCFEPKKLFYIKKPL